MAPRSRALPPRVARLLSVASVASFPLLLACGRRDHAGGAPPAASSSASPSTWASPSASVSASTSASAAQSALAPTASEGAFLVFKVPIKVKPGATIKVAHQPAAVVDGAVEVRGRPGQSVMVTARDEAGHLSVQKVTIEADGPVPGVIDLSK